MGRIDTKSRLYLQQKEVFADAFNYYIYDGKPVIRPEELAEQDISELSVHYGADGEEDAVQRYRDVLKLAVLMEDGRKAYLMLGLEAQDQVHYALPVRNMLYDALRYKKQVEERASFHRKVKDSRGHSSGEFLSGFYKEDRLIPVITLVILLSPKQWDGPLSIHEMLDVKDEYLLSLVPDYKVNLITPYDMDEKNLKKLRSSLREVLQFIKYSENKEKMKEIVEENERYREMDPKAVSLLNSCTKVEIKIEEEEEKVNMCKAWDDMAKECEEKGRREEHERMCKAWDDMAKECEEKGRREEHERMCKAWDDMAKECEEKGRREEHERMCKAWDDMAKECEEKGRREEHERMCKAWDDMAKECEEKGEDHFAKLSSALLEAERYEDLRKAGYDLAYRKKLYREFCL